MTKWPVFFCVLFIRPSLLIVADQLHKLHSRKSLFSGFQLVHESLDSCTNWNPLKSDCEGIRLCGTVDFNDYNLINCPRRMFMVKGSSGSSLIADLQCDRSRGQWKSIQIVQSSNITGRIVERGTNVYCEYDECVSSKLFPPCGTDIECKEHYISTSKLHYSCPRKSALWTRRSEAEDWVKLEDAKYITCHKERFWANNEALPAGTQASCREPCNHHCYSFFFQDKTPAAKKEYDFNTPPINSPVGNSPKVKSPDVGSPHVAATPSNKNVSAEPETGTPRKAPSTEKGGVTTSADKITNEDLMSKEKMNENQVFNI
ncbi:hypothetical protein PRIPAC_70640 [Pristionchus pacificus]|uniref:Uncharacterized protein n=1 Tax=Pristionchus pacificus TaxID=54126 RepID=A0A2A6C165_PRIPA|nr:hypothetical protein PRIPAC_70640 [Pristionchus pacificus]|eukprot:PDM71856.1 hypothetical protein PRIPAC_38263 [Pristionchus pacificus]